MTGRSADEERGGTYEVTVAGSLGPVLRAAFATRSITTVEATTIRVAKSGDRGLVDLVEFFEAAGVQVQAVYRLRQE